MAAAVAVSAKLSRSHLRAERSDGLPASSIPTTTPAVVPARMPTAKRIRPVRPTGVRAARLRASGEARVSPRAEIARRNTAASVPSETQKMSASCSVVTSTSTPDSAIGISGTLDRNQPRALWAPRKTGPNLWSTVQPHVVELATPCCVEQTDRSGCEPTQRSSGSPASSVDGLNDHVRVPFVPRLQARLDQSLVLGARRDNPPNTREQVAPALSSEGRPATVVQHGHEHRARTSAHLVMARSEKCRVGAPDSALCAWLDLSGARAAAIFSVESHLKLGVDSA